MRAWKEIQKMLLETGRKAILDIQCYTERLSELTPTVVCKAELIHDEPEYLIKICKQSVGGMA